MPFVPIQWKGRMKRTPAQQVALAVRILDDRHFADVYDRALAELGDRGAQLGPLDLTRNTLRSYVERMNRAHESPALVSGLSEEHAALLGDYSASTLVEKYAAVDGRPFPTDAQEAARWAAYYWLGAGYAGVALDYSERSQRAALKIVKPDDLALTYASDDPSEPTMIAHRGQREWEGRLVDVEEVYDLTDLDTPSYRVMYGDEDITAGLFGQTHTGDGYLWRYADGRPFHRIVILGDDSRPYRTNGLIEATLRVSVMWTYWGAGIRDAGHPSRHVRGMVPEGMDAESDGGSVGIESGPEIITRWVDTDPDRPGTHWQWGPGFDPEVTGRAVRSYELTTLSALGLPVDYERTGGEPTEQERKAMEAIIARTYPEQRRFAVELLRRSAAMLNRMQVGSGNFNESDDYGVLFREEVAAALGVHEEDNNDGRPDDATGRGEAGREPDRTAEPDREQPAPV